MQGFIKHTKVGNTDMEERKVRGKKSLGDKHRDTWLSTSQGKRNVNSPI